MHNKIMYTCTYVEREQESDREREEKEKKKRCVSKHTTLFH